MQSPPLPLIIFTTAYLVAAVIASFVQGNLEFLFYVLIMLILIGAVWLAHRHIRLQIATLWGLSLWGLAHMAGGLLVVPGHWPTEADSHVLYSLWLIPNHLKYDQIVHAYGFGITTWVCWQGIRSAITSRSSTAYPSFGLMVLSAAAAMGFGALNEVVEFAATLLLPKTNVGGYINTGWDLVANLTGASVAAALIMYFGRNKS